jgi:hypothetical protein
MHKGQETYYDDEKENWRYVGNGKLITEATIAGTCVGILGGALVGKSILSDESKTEES